MSDAKKEPLKNLVSDYLALDVRRLKRDGMLVPGRPFEWQWHADNRPIGGIKIIVADGRLILTYVYRTAGAGLKHAELPISLAWTQCNYSGRRPWFLCPGKGKDCGRRVAILYAGETFVCRHCRQLAYPTQRLQPWERALQRAQSIRMRLGGSGSLHEPIGPKPKGMHETTYANLRVRALVEGQKAWPPWYLRQIPNC
jgi:hypothetical protein